MFHGAGEYARGSIYTNTIEGFFSFKRGICGVYQHCREKHLHRYLAEFDFRYSNGIALGCDDVTFSDDVLETKAAHRVQAAQIKAMDVKYEQIDNKLDTLIAASAKNGATAQPAVQPAN